VPPTPRGSGDLGGGLRLDGLDVEGDLDLPKVSAFVGFLRERWRFPSAPPS